ncbi:MAG: hypothetical protein M3008_08540, partial [Chloroflexota bacterium]|nr:hypothetical protein [Chloroflexota bacterium]
TNARLAAQAASFQTLSRADTTARDQGLRPATPSGIVYLTLPDVPDAPPTAVAAPSPAPGLRQRLVSALTGSARAENSRLATTATPGVKP